MRRDGDTAAHPPGSAVNADKVLQPGESTDLDFDPAQAHLFAPSDEVSTPH